MLYIRFLNLQNPLQDVEQLYKDGTIEQGDIVCQQYTDKYSHLFMNGTWIKTKYISKIAQNTEVEDDVKTLYDSIVNISTNLSDNYLTKEQYLEDEELIAVHLQILIIKLMLKLNYQIIILQIQQIYLQIYQIIILIRHSI